MIKVENDQMFQNAYDIMGGKKTLILYRYILFRVSPFYAVLAELLVSEKLGPKKLTFKVSSSSLSHTSFLVFLSSALHSSSYLFDKS